MFTNRSRRGARILLALASAGLMSSTPGHALMPDNVLAVVEAAQDTAAPVKIEAPVAPAIVEEGKAIGEGEASYYGNELAGNRTASGERFNPRAMTAAHRTLPLGSKLRVTNKANGKSVIVRINDRGPFVKSRLIDVSYAAAQQINMIRSGHARVRLELLSS
jgi:rare lipoprotein A